MTLADGEDRDAIPSMSWNPVVRASSAGLPARDNSSGPSDSSVFSDNSGGQPEPDTPTAEVTFSMPSLAPAPASVESAPSSAPPAAPEAKVLFTMAIDTMDAEPPSIAPFGAPTSALAPAPAPASPPLAPASLSLSVPSMASPEAPPLTLSTQVFASSELVAPVAPQAAPAAPAPPTVSTLEAALSGAVPTIVEATPPPAVQSEVAGIHGRIDAGNSPAPAPAAVAAPSPAQAPQATAATTPTGSVPVVASPPPVAVQHHQPDQLALTLPAQASLPRSAQAARPGEHVLAAQKRPKQKDRSTAVARVGFFLLFIAALVSAGVIFGRPYLFPAEWQDDAMAYAQPIETARGSKFAEPVVLTAQPSAAHADMVAAQLLGDAQRSMAEWRALGLAGPDGTDDAALRALIAEQAPVIYSTLDGQVYYDESFVDPSRGALITQALAIAAIDQDLSFSAGASERTLDAEALVQAHASQQATSIQLLAAPASGAVAPANMAPLAFLPAVLDYEITAPVVFGGVLAPYDSLAANPLADIASTGPGPLVEGPVSPIPSVSTVGSDQPVGTASPRDQSYWYLVFASHLDAVTAYDLSNLVARAGLQMVEGSNGTCAVATFGMAATDSVERFAVGLEAWVAAAAPELGASVTRLPDGNIQLRSCDPVTGYTSTARFGTARSLMAWRSVEIAVTNAVVAQGGNAATLNAALAAIPTTSSVLAYVGLPAGSSPADFASGARSAAADVVVLASTPGG